MRQILRKGKEKFRKSRMQGSASNNLGSNSAAGNLSSNTISEGTACTGRNDTDAASASSGVVTPVTQPPPTLTDPVAQGNIGSASGSANANDEIRSLWQRALNDPSLSARERQTLQVLQVELQPTTKTIEVSEAFGNFMKDVVDKRQCKDWKFIFRGEHISMKEVSNKIISWVDKFKEIGDIMIQFDPVHAALPWAGFRFLLKICVDKHKTMEAILIGLEKMIFLIDQCALYEGLYLRLDTEASKHLEKHMLRLYTAILKFLANAIDRLEDNRIQAVFNTDDVSEHLRRVEEIGKTVEIYAQTTENQNTREEFKGIKNLLRELRETNLNLQPQLNAIQQHLEQSRRSEILNWISEIPYSEHHKRISHERLKGTGKWLFERQEYSDWRHSNTSKLLLLGGIPGAGKTYTASTVIDSFLEATERFAYFYCNRAEADRRDPEKILSTIVQQLSKTGSKEGLLTPVVEIFEDREEEGQTSAKLSLAESQALLVQLADLYPNHETTICIDAMDEVNNETRIALLGALKDVINHSRSVIKIFVTTRMDRDILYQFRIFPLIELQPDDNATDIDNFIGIKVHSFINEKNWLDRDVERKLRREICSILGTRCKGNFQLASLQIQLLRQLDIMEDIEGELRKLPDTLAKTYDEIYRNIRSKPGRSARVALNAFRWIQCSNYQLKSEELLNVVNAEVSSTGEFHTISAEVEAETLLAVCQNLVVLDKRLNVFRFAHLSVDEYLETKLPKEDSHLEIASICLSLLCTDDAAWDTLRQNLDDWGVQNSDLEADEAFKRKNFLFFYSHICWPWHFSQCGLITPDGHIISRLWDKFSAAEMMLGNTSNTYMKRWGRLYDRSRQRVKLPNESERDSFFQRSEIFQSFRRTISDNEYPLVCVCIFRLYQGMKAVLGSGVETGQSTLDMLLTTSISDGDLEIARVLLDKGASVSVTNESGDTALHEASSRGHTDMVQLLIHHGANVCATNGSGDTPLHVASSGGHKIVAQLFIDKGANVSATNGSGDTPLHEASSGGHTDVARLLIDNGANVSATNGSGDMPLHEASSMGHKVVAQLLIEKGADVSAINGSGDTPLHIASSGGHKVVARLLIDKGANVSAMNRSGDTPLHVASSGGHKIVAQLLIDKGANVSATNGSGDTPLHIALLCTHSDVAHLLVDKGADVSVTNGSGDIPLHMALRCRQIDVAHLLIDKGADVSTTDGYGDTPLHIALQRRHTDVAQLLIDKGANVSTPDRCGDTPLHLALRYNSQKFSQLLIEKGANVSAENTKGETPLGLARRMNSNEIVQLLVTKGATSRN